MTTTDADRPGYVAWRLPYRPTDPWHDASAAAEALQIAVRDLLDPGPGFQLTVEEVGVITVEELTRQARNRRPDLVGVDEFREILAPAGQDTLSRQRFYQLRDRPDFPRPIHRGIWLRHVAQEYADGRNTSAGRPPQEREQDSDAAPGYLWGGGRPAGEQDTEAGQ